MAIERMDAALSENPLRPQPNPERFGKRRARIGAREDADERDADLDRGKEAARVLRKPQGGLRPRLPCSAIASRRARREDTIAISDMANQPLRIRRKTTIPISKR